MVYSAVSASCKPKRHSVVGVPIRRTMLPVFTPSLPRTSRIDYGCRIPHIANYKLVSTVALAPGTTVQDLPLELLQYAVNFVPHCWLPNVRLWCKTLYHAADNAFADAYLRDLTCYILDPRRQERIKNIVTSPRLGLKVNRLTLATNCFERPPLPFDAPIADNNYRRWQS
jgi:hypothetical protein